MKYLFRNYFFDKLNYDIYQVGELFNFKNWEDYHNSKEVAKSKQCCSGQDIMDAKRVAHQLDINHKVLFYQNKFKEGVIDNFVESY